MSQATTLKPGQIRHLLSVTAGTSRHPERDILVLLLGLTCGMRVSEIAQIEIHDILFPSGAIRGVPLIPVHSTTVAAPSIHAGSSGAHRNISF